MLTKGFAFSFRALRMGFILVAAMLLVSCGGGGGGTSTPTAADPTGYYGTSGTMTIKATDGSQVTLETQSIVENNQILLFSSNGFDVYDIHLTSITGNDFSGTAKVYEFFADTQSTADLTVSGTITAGSSITGTFSSATASFGQGTFSLVYNNQMGTIPTTPSNDWQFYVAFNNVDFVTDGAGGIASGTPGTPKGVFVFAGVFANCVVNPVGTTAEIGSSKIYKVALTLADSGGTCAFAGDYTGYAVAQDATPTALAMAMVVKDGSKAFGGSLTYIAYP